MEKDLRSTISLLEKSGDLVHIKKEIDPRLEIFAALLHRPKGVALCFDRVKGCSLPVEMFVEADVPGDVKERIPIRIKGLSLKGRDKNEEL